MFGFLKALVSSAGKPLWIEAFHLDTPIKLPTKIETPGGAKVTVITACVDVRYEIRDKQIVIKRVRLSRGKVFEAAGQKVNVAARSGEVWFARELPITEAVLRKAVEYEIAPSDSNLRRMMIGKWLGANGESIAQPVIDALNARQSAAHIDSLIEIAGRSHRISFTYHSPKKGAERRVVLLHGAAGDTIRATDAKDYEAKTFRIDRMSNVQLDG